LPGSAEAQVIRGGIAKCLLIAYFIGNISAKTCQNPFTCVKVLRQAKRGTFLRHDVVHYGCNNSITKLVLLISQKYLGLAVTRFDFVN